MKINDRFTLKDKITFFNIPIYFVSIMALLFENYDPSECPHDNHYIEDGMKICSNCGEQLTQFMYEINWGMYGNVDFKEDTYEQKAKNAKKTSSGIIKELVEKKFPENVAGVANEYYQAIIESDSINSGDDKVKKKRIFRGNNRDALMASCIFYAQMHIGAPMDAKQVRGHFRNLTQTKFNRALDIFCKVHGNCEYIEPENLLQGIFKKLGITTTKHLIEATKLCRFLEKMCPIMSRSKPDSIAAAVIYLLMSKDPETKDKFVFSKSSFAATVGLSDATLEKLIRDAEKILGKEQLPSLKK